MTTPPQALAQSLELLQKLQAEGKVALQSDDLARSHRERLCAQGFLQEVMKGWYIPTRPDETKGESTAWFASFWPFCSQYLTKRFGSDWCLSPEQSLKLHIGNWTVPQQLVVRASKASNNVTQLPHDVSLLDISAAMPESGDREQKQGLFVYSLPAALIASAPIFFRQASLDARAALSTVSDASNVLSLLLEGGHVLAAGRLAGAFRNIGRDRIADDILNTLREAGFKCHEKDPFEQPNPTFIAKRETSPYVNRLRLMWQEMRDPVLKVFPEPPGLPTDPNTYLKQVDDLYVSDAYHSLSIEGYRVTPDLIQKIRTGDWNPDNSHADREHRSALAARGYWEAFQEVKSSLQKILSGDNAGQVVDADHGNWYRKLFAPSVATGILRAGDLAGYRNDQVYIRRSMHVPPHKEAVRELMPTFFELLQEEAEPAVRVVLGHFFFVYIHPYMDGNGRIGRFLMNAVLASGGYPWTIVPVEKRDSYISSLETASVKQDISAFAEFLAEIVIKL